ncbi:TetR/AcrR family transcriptional regulator [Smaragdicoccus niigatensis]|uniref:TetR/AcrR family transcriptional regulator n=1 Tax=Smaragdicoccus niigatensis TaxID=359359 RepID=UPI000361E0B7|nr:TetR/AcrR family transcriptional regulator [Smaragdicoccus niigatensis]
MADDDSPTLDPNGRTVSARERILQVAYQLFTRRGIRDVGIDELIARAKVAKASFYRHFPSKNDLILEVLQRREQLWTHGLVEKQSRERGATPEEQLLAIFDVFDDWFHHHEAFDGCSFINVLLEMGSSHPAGKASIRYLENIRAILQDRAQQAGLRDAENFARSFHVLMKGSIVSATEGDLLAAQRAKTMARSLIDSHR